MLWADDCTNYKKCNRCKFINDYYILCPYKDPEDNINNKIYKKKTTYIPLYTMGFTK